MASIFLSYARKDKQIAQAIVAHLAERNCSVWWDQTLEPGAQWDRGIERELASASCVLVIWTTTSITSEYVRNEAAFALKQGTLFPIAVDGAEPPLEFGKRQNATLSTGLEFANTVAAIVLEVVKRVSAPRTEDLTGNDWRTSGGFRSDDPLLQLLPAVRPAGVSRYEMCRRVIDARQGSEPVADRAKEVFAAFASDNSGVKEPDQRDAETALLLAHELVHRYSDFGGPLRGVRSANSRGRKRQPKEDQSHFAPETPAFFSRVYLNTVNTFVKDILGLVAHNDVAARAFGIRARESDIAAASIHIIRTPRLETSRNSGRSIAGPEVHAAYVLGRLTQQVTVLNPLDALHTFERKLDDKLKNLSNSEDDTARRLRLMRRTAILSQAMLNSPPALERYVSLLQNSALEVDANAGFHLEYYCDQLRDTQLPLCSRDDGRGCENTVRQLCTSLGAAVSSGWKQSANPLLLIEAYTLGAVIAHRLHGEFDKQARAGLPTIERVYSVVEDEDTKIYFRLLLDVAGSGPDYAAKEFGRFMAAKNAPRNGWVKRGIRFPETVGAHTASAIWLCRLLPRYDGSVVNYSRIRRMIEIHDLAEGITSDIVASNKTHDSEAERKERALMRRLSWLGFFLRPQVDLVDCYPLFDEFTKESTIEAQIARDLDRLDIVLQGTSLIRIASSFDTAELRALIQRSESEILTREVKAILPSVRLMQVISAESFSTTIECELKNYYFPTNAA